MTAITAVIALSALAEAQREGLSAEEYHANRALQIRRAAESVGLTEQEFRDLMEIAEKARSSGYGISLPDWQAATNRVEYGRKKAQ